MIRGPTLAPGVRIRGHILTPDARVRPQDDLKAVYSFYLVCDVEISGIGGEGVLCPINLVSLPFLSIGELFSKFLIKGFPCPGLSI